MVTGTSKGKAFLVVLNIRLEPQADEVMGPNIIG